MVSFGSSITCGLYKAAVTKRIDYCKEMRTGWSQDEGSQSQPREEAKHIERQNCEKKTTEPLLGMGIRRDENITLPAMTLPRYFEAVNRDADSSLTNGVSAVQPHDPICNNKRKKYDKTSNSDCSIL